MSTIFVVSPMYLEVIIRESKYFSFNLQGYGSFELARNGILEVNAQDVIGYAFIGDSMPVPKSREFGFMLEFLNLCNLMGRKKFVVVTRSALRGNFVDILKEYAALEFFAASGNEHITDAVIRTNVFGSLLMTVREPYKLKAKERKAVGEFACPTMRLIPAVNYFLLRCLEPVSVLETVEQTKEYDSVYQEYVKSKSVLAELREIRILNGHGKECRHLLSSIYRRVEDGVCDGNIPASYLSVIDLVREEVGCDDIRN